MNDESVELLRRAAWALLSASYSRKDELHQLCLLEIAMEDLEAAWNALDDAIVTFRGSMGKE